MRVRLFAFWSSVFYAGWAHAACVTPVADPAHAPRAAWTDLESLVADAALNPQIEKVQTISGSGHGALNTDFYAILVDKSGQSAAQLMAEIRHDMSDVIFAGSSYSLSAYDDANGAIWSSSSPKGALMSFTLAKIPGVVDLERGSVVVSCFTDTDFTFSTVTTTKDGLHPVAGNRGFGVRDLGNGTLQVFTKAADRVVNEGVFSLLPEIGREKIFEQGHKVWLRLLDNIATKYAGRNPRNKIIYSERKTY